MLKDVHYGTSLDVSLCLWGEFVCVLSCFCFKNRERESKKLKKLKKKKRKMANFERTCTEPCLSAGVKLPNVPCLGTSGHAATPPLFVFLFK